MNKKLILAFLAIFLLANITSLALAVLSNESTNTEENIMKAEACINEMTSLNIPTKRVNESYNEALQLYSAQFNLERMGRKVDYTLVNEYTINVCKIKESSIKARDELNIFKQTYEETSKRTNLSSMREEYLAIINSFDEERFEETITLVDEGYKRLSEIEASQTTVRLFYSTTTKTLKTFFIENWKKLTIFIIIILILVLIFWKPLIRFRINFKLHRLELRKQAINELIKKMQFSYFRTKSMSEIEYSVKLEKFKEITRDINREIPALKEDLLKLDKLNKSKKKG